MCIMVERFPFPFDKIEKEPRYKVSLPLETSRNHLETIQ
jgi:hypothetical protein